MGCAAGRRAGVSGPPCGPMACWHAGVTQAFMCFHQLELLFRDDCNRYVLNMLLKVIEFGCIVCSLCLSFKVALGKS